MRRAAGSFALRPLLLSLALALPGAAGASSSPPEARLQVELARVLRQIGNSRAAETALERALEIDARCAAAWLERGFLAESERAPARARRAFARAFELAPELGDPLRNPEIVGSRAALAAQLELWRRAESSLPGEPTTALAAEIAAPRPSTARAVKPRAADAARVLRAGDLVASGPVNQALSASAEAGRAANNRRSGRVQRFRPPPVPVVEIEEAPPESTEEEEMVSSDEAMDESGVVSEEVASGSEEEPPPEER